LRVPLKLPSQQHGPHSTLSCCAELEGSFPTLPLLKMPYLSELKRVRLVWSVHQQFDDIVQYSERVEFWLRQERARIEADARLTEIQRPAEIDDNFIERYRDGVR
jgi:hypothetical protein